MNTLEVELLSERISAGLSAARDRGITLGRPIKRNTELIRALRKQGMTYKQIKEETGTSIGSIQLALK